MPLPTNLNTNEVKNASGVEIEFLRRDNGPGSTVVFAQANETPAMPHRIKVSHQDIGSGTGMRRRSALRVDKQHMGESDPTKQVQTSAYVVVDLPIGQLANYNTPKDVLAELMSLLASTGADTAIKFDCTGNGASALINGTL